MDLTTEFASARSIAGISRFNARGDHVVQDQALDALAHMIGATGGWVNPIVIVDDTEPNLGDKAISVDSMNWHVLAGRRRWHALQRAFELELLPQDTPLRVSIFSGTEVEARELSLMENVGHQPMTPVEEVIAYGSCHRAGRSAADIATHFGAEIKTVKARLALAHLHPTILEAWRDGSILLASAEAFCSSTDQDQQIEIWNGSPQLRRNPFEIRKRLRGEAVVSTSSLATFVGAEAYAAAGGRLDEDLFADDTYWLDAGIARDLAQKRLAAAAQKIIAREGWGWFRTEFDADATSLRNFHEDAADYKDSEEREIDENDAALRSMTPGTPETIALLERNADLIAKGWTRGIAKGRRAKLGICVQISHDGKFVECERALETKAMREAREEKLQRATGKTTVSHGGDADDDDAPVRKPPPPKQPEALLAAANTAIPAAMRRNPATALRVLLVALSRPYWQGSFGFQSEMHVPSIANPLLRQLQTTRDFDEAMLVAVATSDEAVQAALADCVAASLTDRDGDEDAALVDAIGTDPAFDADLIDAFDAVAYLDQLDQLDQPGRDAIKAGTSPLLDGLPLALREIVRDAAADKEPVATPDTRTTAEAMAEAMEEDDADTGGDVPPIEERFTAFANASIIRETDSKVKAQHLVDAYNAYATARGWPPSNASALSPLITARDIASHRFTAGVHYMRIALKTEGV